MITVNDFHTLKIFALVSEWQSSPTLFTLAFTNSINMPFHMPTVAQSYWGTYTPPNSNNGRQLANIEFSKLFEDPFKLINTSKMSSGICVTLVDALEHSR